jgi:hypothetical protein
VSDDSIPVTDIEAAHVVIEDEDVEHEESEDAIQTADNPVVMKKMRVFLESLNVEELEILLEARKKSLGEVAYAITAGTEGSYDAILSELSVAHSVDADRSRAAIGEIKNTELFKNRLVVDGKTILGTPKLNRASGNGAVLVGADALAAFAIRDGWLKRVVLYNSGFSIDIIAPSLLALNTFFNKAYDATNSYGRQYGGLFFYFHDLMIKEAIVELVLPLIINSTLRDANRHNTLIRNIKLVDLKLILNAIGALMFPDGFAFTHVCSNPDGTCNHFEEVLIDINKLAFYDFNKMSTDCRQHMARKSDITQELLATYQHNLGFDGTEIRYLQYGFTMQQPSLSDHLDYGRRYNGELLSTVFVDKPDVVSRAVLYSYYQIYTPFITKLTLYNADGSVDIITEDRDVITHMLLRLQIEDTEGTLIKEFDAFVAKSEISYICYPAVACPSCKYVPRSGYYTVDPILTFFMLSLTKLNLN